MRRRFDRAVLFRRRQIAVQRQDEQILLVRQFGTGGLCAPDFCRAGQKHEHIAVQPFANQTPHRPSHLFVQRSFIAARQMFNCHIKAFAF